MPRSVKELNWAVVNNFIGRKKALTLAVIVNLKTNEIFPIPTMIEHADYVPRLLGITKDDLKENPALAGRIIPSLIEFRFDDKYNYIVKALITGVSGLEIGFKVRHSRDDLINAHKIILAFIKNGDFPKDADFKDGINYKYAIKQ